MLATPSRITFAQVVPVPGNHWCYHFIDRLEAHGLLDHAITGTKPWSRQDVARTLYHVYQHHVSSLSHIEQQQLNDLLVEFADALDVDVPALHPTRLQRVRNHPSIDRWLPDAIYPTGRHLFEWKDEQIAVFGDPVILYQHQSGKNTDVTKVTNGFALYGMWHNWLHFFVDARDNTESGGDPYQQGNYTLPRRGFVRSTSPNVLSYDETEAGIILTGKGVRLTYGKFKNQWGPARSGNLILSDYATSYDQIKFEVVHPRFVLTSIYAYLIDYVPYDWDRLLPKKYFAGHRLEISPGWRFNIGLSETVVFKDRSFEPSYLNPMMFYRSAEHYHGSPDNALMGVDIAWRPIRNWKLYSELLIDDITTSKIGTDWYGNKWGYITGIFFVTPLTRYTFDVRLEYGRLRPYVYTHWSGANYTHYNSTLGYWSPPNAENLFFEVNSQITRSFGIRLNGSYWRHGANWTNKNVGGNINQPFEFDENNAAFLSGVREERSEINIVARYKVFWNWFFDFRYCYTNENSFDDHLVEVAVELRR